MRTLDIGGLAAPQDPCFARGCAPGPPAYCTTAIAYCTIAIVHECTIAIVHACTIAIVHACTIAIVHACTIAIVHAQNNCTEHGGRPPRPPMFGPKQLCRTWEARGSDPMFSQENVPRNCAQEGVRPPCSAHFKGRLMFALPEDEGRGGVASCNNRSLTPPFIFFQY